MRERERESRVASRGGCCIRVLILFVFVKSLCLIVLAGHTVVPCTLENVNLSILKCSYLI